MGKGLSRSAYARHRKAQGLPGGSHVAVIKALKDGRIVLEPDGTIDPAKADAAWQSNTNGALQRARPAKAVETAPEADSRAGATYAEVRAAHEQIRARREKIKLDRELGNLVPADKVAGAFRDVSQVLRDRLLNIPERLRRQAPAQLVQLVEDEIRSALDDAAAEIAKRGYAR